MKTALRGTSAAVHTTARQTRGRDYRRFTFIRAIKFLRVLKRGRLAASTIARVPQ
jgi:hypothetical protein